MVIPAAIWNPFQLLVTSSFPVLRNVLAQSAVGVLAHGALVRPIRSVSSDMGGHLDSAQFGMYEPNQRLSIALNRSAAS